MLLCTLPQTLHMHFHKLLDTRQYAIFFFGFCRGWLICRMINARQADIEQVIQAICERELLPQILCIFEIFKTNQSRIKCRSFGVDVGLPRNYFRIFILSRVRSKRLFPLPPSGITAPHLTPVSPPNTMKFQKSPPGEPQKNSFARLQQKAMSVY